MIHYHGTPFSGGDKNHMALAGRHAMVSYAHASCMAIVAEVCQSFCLDNGAFSAWKAGKKFDPEGFMDWAHHWVKHPGCDFAVLPDIIDGTEKENDNWLKFAPNKHQWTPVWHLHESIERLERLANEWPRIALGSSGEYAEVGNTKWWHRMGEGLDAITDRQGRPICKIHGLRMLDTGIFSYIPFSSADSTNVGRNIGIDKRWTGPYVPKSGKTKALVMMDRIEIHASASHWPKGLQVHNQQNFDLLG